MRSRPKPLDQLKTLGRGSEFLSRPEVNDYKRSAIANFVPWQAGHERILLEE